MEKNDDNQDLPFFGATDHEGYREFLMRSERVEVKDLVPEAPVRSFANCENFVHLRQVLREPFDNHLMMRKGVVLNKCVEICKGVKDACLNAVHMG